MENDCEQCREWELCPFHPKDDPIGGNGKVIVTTYEYGSVATKEVAKTASVDGLIAHHRAVIARRG